MKRYDFEKRPEEFEELQQTKLYKQFIKTACNYSDCICLSFDGGKYEDFLNSKWGYLNECVIRHEYTTQSYVTQSPEALMFSEPSRVVFLIKEPSNLVDEYRERWDHQGFNEYINSASNVESAKKTVSRTLYELNVKRIEEVKNSQFFWLERTDASPSYRKNNYNSNCSSFFVK